MIVVRFSSEHAPTAQNEARKFKQPIREEWQPDGSWTGLFDIENDELDSFHDLIRSVGDEGTQVKEIDSEDEIEGHRMAFYVFNY